MGLKDRKLFGQLNRFILLLDKLPLWWSGLLLLAITFLPYFILGEGSIIEIHDQLDETIMTYVLHARHLGEGLKVFPEMLGGVPAGGMQPSALLFIPLYRFLPALTAFLVQYAIVFLAGFFGMYASVKELTGSSIISTVSAGCFSLLPIQPIYGLSVLGVPLLLYAFLCLFHKKREILSYLLVVFFGLTTHLVLIGYVVLSFWLLALVVEGIQRRQKGGLIRGFLLLLGIYLVENRSLFVQLVLGNGDYVSHREEQINYAQPFWESAKDLFLNSAQHAPSLHTCLILPILLLLVLGAVIYRKRQHRQGTGWHCYLGALAGLVILIGIAILYGICKTQWVADIKNNMSGFLRYFQLERYYWLYPVGWYLELALAFGAWWKGERCGAPFAKLLLLFLILLPTLNEIKLSSHFYRNVNQINNGSGVTGYISWENYYGEDLMEELELAIGRDMSTYRIGHLGISPAPSLMHGFYTVDGYSNNYSLDYKHRFRQVIAKELAKSEQTRLYFDQWGSRCYLFNGATGTYWNVSKRDGVIFENLEFDMEALGSLGCEYLFSGGEITNARELGLDFMGYFEEENSYWGIWLYRLSPGNS